MRLKTPCHPWPLDAGHRRGVRSGCAGTGQTRPMYRRLGQLLGQLVKARLDPLPERQVLAAIKTATGIAVSILDKQIGELRRRLNSHREHPSPAEPPALGEPAAPGPGRHARAQRSQRHHGTVLRRGIRWRPGVRRVPSGDHGRPQTALGRPAHPAATAVDGRRRRPLCRVAAASRNQCPSGRRQPQRHRRGARHPDPPSPRLLERSRLGRRAAPRYLGPDLPRRRRHAAQPRVRLAVGDLGRRPHHAARRQGRPHADPGRPSGRPRSRRR